MSTARAAALREGRPTFTGAPCAQGHVERYVNSRKCVACNRAAQLRYSHRCSQAWLDANTAASRGEAILQNLRYYKRDAPCPHGHSELWFTSSNKCVTCAQSANRARNGTKPAPVLHREVAEVRHPVVPPQIPAPTRSAMQVALAEFSQFQTGLIEARAERDALRLELLRAEITNDRLTQTLLRAGLAA